MEQQSAAQTQKSADMIMWHPQLNQQYESITDIPSIVNTAGYDHYIKPDFHGACLDYAFSVDITDTYPSWIFH